MPDALGSWRRGPGPALILGHRGARRDAPENSQLAFDLALDQGAVGVEFDVRLGGEGRVIVLHDADLTRVTGGRDTRHAEALSQQDLARVDLGQGQAVPTLLQVLQWARGNGALLNVELKSDVSDARALVWGVLAAIAASRIDSRQLLLSSFSLRLLRALYKAAPELPRALLFEQRWRTLAPVRRWVGAAALHPQASLLGPASARSWRQGGLLLNTWTVNDPERARELDALGVDALISDVPGLLVEALRCG